jgi:hypothetical protein
MPKKTKDTKNKFTRFFFISYKYNVKEIPICEVGKKVEEDQQFDNWFFGQMEASIRMAFCKYKLPIPKYAFIDRMYRTCNQMTIVLVRDNVRNEKEASKWVVDYLCVLDDLEHQAWANSDEDNIVFKFKII